MTAAQGPGLGVSGACSPTQCIRSRSEERQPLPGESLQQEARGETPGLLLLSVLSFCNRASSGPNPARSLFHGISRTQSAVLGPLLSGLEPGHSEEAREGRMGHMGQEIGVPLMARDQTKPLGAVKACLPQGMRPCTASTFIVMPTRVRAVSTGFATCL